LLRRIKQTKAVLGVSDIKLKKHLRVILSKALHDEEEKERLADLEALERQIMNERKTKSKQDLKNQLKEKLGIDDSGFEEELEELDLQENEE